MHDHGDESVQKVIEQEYLKKQIFNCRKCVGNICTEFGV